MLDQIINLLAPLVALLVPILWNQIKDRLTGLPPLLIPIIVAGVSSAATFLADLAAGGGLEDWQYVLAGIGAVFLRELLKHLEGLGGILGFIGKLYLGPPTPGGPRSKLGK